MFLKNITGILLLVFLSAGLASAASGDLDRRFHGGLLQYDNSGGKEYGSAVAVQAGGKVIVAGKVGTDALVLRFNPDGTLDTTFNRTGYAVYSNSGKTSSAEAVAIQADGKIVVAGHCGSDVLLLRYKQDGTLDQTFSADGVGLFTVKSESTEQASAVAIQADGKIVVSGRTRSGEIWDVLLMRISNSGNIDSTFGGSGFVTYSGQSGGDDQANAVALQADGKIVTSGTTSNGSNEDILLLRYNPDGSPDVSFGVAGVVVFDRISEHGEGLALQADGKLIVSGYISSNTTNNDVLLVRFNDDGILDVSFGEAGVVTYNGPLDSDEYSYSVAMQSDGKIVVTGKIEGRAVYELLLLRFDADGSLDRSFGKKGRVVISGLEVVGEKMGIFVQSDGKIVVAGTSHNGSDEDILVGRFIGERVTISSPAAGDALRAGAGYLVEWAAPPAAVEFKLFFSEDDGLTWNRIPGDLSGRFYVWNFPAPRGNLSRCRLKIIGFDMWGNRIGASISDRFSIEVVRLLSPNGGEGLRSGDLHEIRWETYETIRPAVGVVLFYTMNGGRTWKEIGQTVSSGSFLWEVPALAAEKKACRLKIKLIDEHERGVGVDKSDAVFTMSPGP